MILTWTRHGLNDLVRLHSFLHPVNAQAAAKTIQSLSRAAERLVEHPRLGEKLPQYAPREVRHLIVSHYEIRYEIMSSHLYILRLWHTREHR